MKQRQRQRWRTMPKPFLKKLFSFGCFQIREYLFIDRRSVSTCLIGIGFRPCFIVRSQLNDFSFCNKSKANSRWHFYSSGRPIAWAPWSISAVKRSLCITNVTKATKESRPKRGAQWRLRLYAISWAHAEDGIGFGVQLQQLKICRHYHAFNAFCNGTPSMNGCCAAPPVLLSHVRNYNSRLSKRPFQRAIAKQVLSNDSNRRVKWKPQWHSSDITFSEHILPFRTVFAPASCR